MGAGGGVRIPERAGVGDQGDVEAERHRFRPRSAGERDQIVDQLARGGRARVHNPEVGEHGRPRRVVVDQQSAVAGEVAGQRIAPLGLAGVQHQQEIGVLERLPSPVLPIRHHVRAVKQKAEVVRKGSRIDDDCIGSPLFQPCRHSRLRSRAIPIRVDMRGKRNEISTFEALEHRLQIRDAVVGNGE